MKIKNKNYVNGFTLIELILALGVGVMVSFIKFQDMKNEQDLMKASAAGEQIQRIGYAVNNYISLRYDKLSTLTSSSSQSNDPGPRTCSGNTCTITVQTLKNDGILPNSYVDSNAFRSPYSIIIKRSGSSPNYILDALITTSSAWIESGNNPRYDLLGFAMQKAGIDSGMTKSNTKADGYNGSWSEQSTSFNNITKAGQLAFRAGYNASLYSAYLRRDGTLPMTGNLNMGNNDINNAKNITASGTGNFGSNVNSGGNVTAAAQVIAHNGYGDTITLGGDAAGNDYEIRLGTAKQLTLYSPSAGNYTTVLQVNRNAKIDQRLGLMGYDPNELPSGWGGGLRTLDVYAAGTVGAGSGGTVNAYMNSSGNIYASNDINAGHQVNAQYVWASGNLNSNYIHSNGNIDADRRINAGEFVYINGQATIGAGCSPNGLIGRTSEGRAVSCVNGAWQAVGSFTRTGCYNVGNHNGRNFNPEYCNVGDYVAGLQFTGHRKSESTYEVICCKP